mmetsp:Transcript_4199/g.13513  ORF Transcript_4199/g.13513 Transcript_4199/m.13513 type:complete len:299 (-) Transcript_4199:451-1347(-)
MPMSVVVEHGASSVPPRRSCRKASDTFRFFMPRHSVSVDVAPASSAFLARSFLMPSAMSATVTGSGWRSPLRRGLLMKVYAAVVYSRSAATRASSSPCATATGCATKSASRSPWRPRSRTPFGKCFSEAGSCSTYCRCTASSASPWASTSATIASTPRSNPWRSSASSTFIKCAIPRAASAGCPEIRLRTSPPNLPSAPPPPARLVSASMSACCSSLVSSGGVSMTDGTRSRVRTRRSGQWASSSLVMHCTSWKTSGGRRISRSCGYCEIQPTSAPESSGPICISSSTPRSALPLHVA